MDWTSSPIEDQKYEEAMFQWGRTDEKVELRQSDPGDFKA